MKIAGINTTDLLNLESFSENSDIIYLSGSLIEKLGNSNSDIDVFVLGDSVPSRGTLKKTFDGYISIHLFNNRRIDFEYLSINYFNSINSKLTKLDFNKDNVSVGVLTKSEEENTHRLRIGLPVLNSEKFQNLKNTIDWNLFLKFLYFKTLSLIDDAIDDIAGMVDDEDYLSAVMLSRKLVELTVDAYLSHRGDSNTKEKWRHRRLERLNQNELDKEVLKLYRELLFISIDFEGDKFIQKEFINKCLSFSNEIIDKIQG